MGKKETLQEPQYNPTAKRRGLSEREKAQFYENRMLNDPSYIQSSDEEKAERLNKYFDDYLVPIEMEGGADPTQVASAREKYLTSKFPPPPSEIDPFPIPSFEDYLPEDPVPPMDWPKNQKPKTEAQREEEAAAEEEPVPDKNLDINDVAKLLMPDGEPEGLLASLPSEEGQPDSGSYMGDVGERVLAGMAKLPGWSKKGSKMAEKLLEAPGRLLAWEMKKLGVNPAKADKAGEFAAKVGFGKFSPVQALKASNDVKELIDTKTDYYKNWEEREKKLLERSERYDKTITELWKAGDKMEAVGAAMLQGAESLPMSMMAAFGGPAGLATIGLMTGGEKYERLIEEGTPEGMALLNGAITGTIEAGTEMGTAGLGYLIKGSIKKIGKEATQELVKTGLRGWIKSMYMKVGLWTAPVQEGVEELVNAVGENLTDKYTGVRPDAEPMDGAWDAFWAGAAGGAYFTAGGAVIKGIDKAVPKPKPGEEAPTGPPTEPPTPTEPPKPPKRTAAGLKLDPEYVEKVKSERKFFDDKRIKEEQEKYNIPDTPGITIEDATDETLDAIDRGEPVMNDRLKMAADNLYGEYKKLAALKSDPKRKQTTEQIDEMMSVLEFEITQLNNRINEQAEKGEFVTEEVELTDKIKVSTITEGVEGKPDEGVPPKPEVVEKRPERFVETPFMDQYQLQERTEVADRVVKAIDKMEKEGLTGSVKNAEDHLTVDNSIGLFGAGRHKINTPEDYAILRAEAEAIKEESLTAIEERKAMPPVKEGMIRYGGQDYASIEELAEALSIHPIERLPQPDLDLNVYKAMELARKIRDDKKPPEEPPGTAGAVVVEKVVEEEPTGEPIQGLGDPALILSGKLGDVNKRFVVLEDAVAAEVEEITKDKADLEERLKKEFKGRLSLDQKKDRKKLEDQIAKIEKDEQAAVDQWQDEVNEFAQKIQPTIEKKIRELAPTITDEEFDKAMWYVWQDISTVQKGEMDKGISIEDHITNVLAGEVFEEPTPPTEEPVEPPAPPPVEDPKARERKHDTLVIRVAQWNKTPATHTQIKGDLMQQISRAVADLGYIVGMVDGQMVVKDENGKKIKQTEMRTPKEEIDAHLALNEYEDQGFIDFVNKVITYPGFLMDYDVDLKASQIASGIKNIEEGKKTVAANKLLDALENSLAVGAIEIKKTKRHPATSVSVEEIDNLIADAKLDEFTNQFGELSPENVDEAIKMGLMTEEEKSRYLKNIEDEIKQTEEAAVTEPGEERLDTGEAKVTKPGENKRERERVINEIDAQITDKRNQIQTIQKQKQKKYSELTGRKGLFGDTKVETGAPGMFDETFDPSDENIKKALQPFDAQIEAINREINNLEQSKSTAGNEAAGQTTIPTQSEYSDLVGKVFFIPELNKEVKVVRVEDWTDPRDQRVKDLGGLFGEAPAEFEKLTVAIIEDPVSIKGESKKAVIVDKFRDLIAKGKATEVEPFDNKEYRTELTKIIDIYKSIGDMAKAEQLEKKMYREPRTYDGSELAWEQDLASKRRVAEFEKRQDDIQTGKIIFAPIPVEEDYTLENVMDLLESNVKRGDPLTPYVLKNARKEDLNRLVKLTNEHHKILAQLGFTGKGIQEIKYLADQFYPSSPIMAMYGIGSHARALDKGHQDSSQKKVDDSIAFFTRSLGETEAKHKLIRQRAFTWEVKNRIWKGEPIADFRELIKIAAKWGVTNKTAIRERAELAMVEVARSIAMDNTINEADQFSRIQGLYSTFPTLSYRTSAIKEKQQYSTPVPLAFLMGEYTNAKSVDNVMDPSAGNGALLISADRRGVRANEIDEGRYQNLIEQGYRVFNKDSTHGIQDQLDVQTVDAVHINPPFGGTTEDFEGYWLHGEYVPVAHALKSLSNTGKAAIITGGHIKWKANGQMVGSGKPGDKNDLQFFNWLYKNYYVEDVIQLPGDLYKTMGASYPVKVILVNGRKTEKKGAAPLQSEAFNPVENWTDVRERITVLKTKANENNSLQRKVDAMRGTDSLVGGRATDQNPATERSGVDPTVSEETDLPAEQGAADNERVTNPFTSRPDPGAGRTRASGTDNVKSTIHKSDGGTDQTGRRGEVGRFGEIRPTRSALDLPTNNIGKPDQRTKRELGISDISADDVTSHRPLSDLGSGNFIVPASIASEMQDALMQLSDEIGDIDEYVREKLNYNSLDEMKGTGMFAEQVDGIGQAIYNIEGKNAMIIGHQTGTGKGRIAAGVIRYAIENGKLPIFITKGADLFTDIYRDMVNIGSPNYKPFIMNKQFASSGQKARVFDKDGNVKWEVDPQENNRIIGTEKRPGTHKLPEGTQMIMTTYSQFTTEGRDSEKRSFLNKLIRDNDVVFVMDESHEASGMSNTGDFFKDWLLGTQGGLFLSATYAKRPDNMPLYSMKTVLQEANMTMEEMIDGILAGGPALQEIITHQLAESGQFAKIGFKMDAEMNYVVIGDTDPSQRTYNPELGKRMVEDFDNITGVLQEIVDFQRDFINPVLEGMNEDIKREGKQVGMRKGTSQAGVNNAPYFSRVWNIIDQLLLSIKVKEAVPLIVEDLKAGRKPVIALKSTMEAMFQKMVENLELKKGETIPLDFSHVLKRGMETVMKYTETDAQGNDVKADLNPEDLTATGRSRYYSMMEKIQRMTTGIPISPIDILRKGITDAGFEAVEITGRHTMFKLNEDGSRGEFVTNDRGDKIKAVARFNNNPGVAAIVNRAGSTGISMHSSPDFLDVSQRTMWTLQNDLDINVVVQLFGRIYRADQLNKPIYNMVTSTLPAESRMFMMNAKKLKSLDANTSGNQKHSKSLADVDDFLNKYGDDVVFEYLKENPDINRRIGDPLNIGGKDPNKQNAAHRVTGKIQILPSRMQEEFYREVAERYRNDIEYRNSTGTNDQMVTNEELDAVFKKSTVEIEGNGGYSYFGDDTVLNEAEVNVTRKPFTKAQLEEQLEKVPDNHVEDLRAAMEKGIESQLDTQIRNVQRSSEEARALWRQKIEDKDGLSPEDKVREYELKKNEIDERESDRINNLRVVSQLNKAKFNKYFDFFEPGKGLEVPFTDDEQLGLVRMNKGVFVSFDVNMNKANPWVPSNVMLKFATTDSRKMFRIPVSKYNHLDAIIGNSYHISNAQSNEIMEDWDNIKKSRTRETRYLVTGNILQGMNKYKKGRLVKFSMEDGSIVKGILMPENWINETSNTARMPIHKAANIIKALAPKTFVEDVSRDIIIKKMDYDSPQMYELKVPASTQRGSKYYSNEVIKSIVRNGMFEQINDRMVARFPEESLQPLLTVLNERFKTMLEVDHKQVQKGNDQTDAASTMDEYGAGESTGPIDRGGLSNPHNDTKGMIYTPHKDRVVPSPKPPKPGFSPKKLWEIQDDISKALGKKIQYTRRPSARRAVGSYDPTIGKLGIKHFGDEDVAAHEIGHYLDDKYGLLGPKAYPIYNELKAELSKLWEYGSKPPRGHKNPERYRMAEGMAEFIRAWVVNPSEAESRFPTTYEWFRSQMQPHTKVWEGLEQFSEDVRTLYGSSALDQTLTNARLDPKVGRKGIAWNRENKEGQFQTTIFDKMGRRIWYFIDPLVEAFKYAAKQQGITDIDDPNQLSPLQNFEIVVRNHLGLDVKLQNLMDKGVMDFDQSRVLDPKTGQAMTFDWMYEAIPGTSNAQWEKNTDITMAVGISERAVELPKKYQARLLRHDLETTTDRLPPLKILAKHPHIIEMWAGKINDIITRMDEGVLDPDDVWISNEPTYNKKGEIVAPGRYDFTDVVSTGVAQSGQRDYDVAVAAVKEFEAMKITDPELYDGIKEFWRRYREISKQWSEYAYQAGLISKETKDQIQNENLDYVAMNRLQAIEPKDMVEGKDLEFEEQQRPTGTGLQPREVVFPFKGSDRPIDNPVSSMIKSWMNLVDVGDMNYSVQTFADMFKRGAVGRNMHEGDVVKHGEIAWVQDYKEPSGYNISFYEKGKKKYLVFGDKYLYETWKDLLPVSDSLGMKIASFFPQLLRRAITKSIRFVNRNMIRDLGQFLVVGTAKRYARPWYILPNKKADDAFERYGGGQFGFVPRKKIIGSQRKESKLPHHQYMMKAKKKGNPNTKYNMVGKGFQFVNRQFNMSERPTRRIQYMASYNEGIKKYGLTHQEAAVRAAYQARDLMDFAAAGTVAKEINKVLIFTSAAVRGMEKIARTARKNPARFAVHLAAFSMLPSILNSLYMSLGYITDDEREEYLSHPNYLRDGFYRFPNPFGRGWIIIPKPFELGRIGSVAQRGMDMALYNDKDAFSDGWWFSFISSMNPYSISGITSGFSGGIGVVANYDMFRQKHIIPPSEKDLAIASRETHNASKFSRLLMEGSDAITWNQEDNPFIDPRMLDYFLFSQFSTYAEYPIGAFEYLPILDDPNRSVALQWDDLGIYKDPQIYGSKHVQHLMTLYNKFPHLKAEGHYVAFRIALDGYFSEGVQSDYDLKAEQGAILLKTAHEIRKALDAPVEETGKPRDFFKEASGNKDIKDAKKSSN